MLKKERGIADKRRSKKIGTARQKKNQEETIKIKNAKEINSF